MCTAVTYLNGDFYFGRTLDYGFCYGEQVTVMPRRFSLPLSGGGVLSSHYGVVGMAHIANGYPLFYDGVNEKGLCMAGLNFVGHAVYSDPSPKGQNVAQYELLPLLLGRCATVAEAVDFLRDICLTGQAFSSRLPTAQLHWLVADRCGAITVESVAGGLKIYENPLGVLANNPPFPVQMARLAEHLFLSPRPLRQGIDFGQTFPFYSHGTGTLGLPGDYTSGSRFIRAAFLKSTAKSEVTEAENVGQFFHILGGVEQMRGGCELPDGKLEMTLYTACINAQKGIYYYTTYGNRQISAVDMRKEDLAGDTLITYPLQGEEQIFYQN